MLAISFSFALFIIGLIVTKKIINLYYFVYLWLKFKLWLLKFRNRRRFDLHSPKAINDLKRIGVMPNNEEYELESPNDSKKEDVDVIGVNSWGQVLHLSIKWLPQTSDKVLIQAKFYLEDGNGNTYHMNETNLIVKNKNNFEYKARGVSLEIINPFRRLRIKFRGYLRNNNRNELIYFRIRVLWLSVSNVFDFKTDFDNSFMAQELSNRSSNICLIPNFEDRFEQFGQMKGTIQKENQQIEELFLWGNKSKKYADNGDISVHRLFGYSKKGCIFHIGSVYDHSNNLSYRYGFAFWQSIIFPITYLSDIKLANELEDEFFISLIACFKTFDIKFKKSNLNKNIFDIILNGHKGRAILLPDDSKTLIELPSYKIHIPCKMQTTELVLPLNDIKSENVSTSGGKGSSLASLKLLSNNIEDKTHGFEVPFGIAVTCNAYQFLLDNNNQIKNEIEKLKSVICESDLLKKQSENVMNAIKDTELNDAIKTQISSNLISYYGENKINQILFAVRSSASEEDSEEMSSAGQMSTYLGVKGLESIYKAVMNCWSSQFDYMAIEYKRGYGQDINSLMAVVIQEMVDCDSAGVMFTCDPITGDERELVITANYGIGESVVSAMSEPDTVRVSIDISDNSYYSRKLGPIKSIMIGSKAKYIRIDNSETGGTKEIMQTNGNHCCIVDQNIIKLATIGLKIQQFFRNVRDIEWGIKDNRIYIFQSRPITNMDSTFTEFELMHELDVGLAAETEYISKANIGEVMPGCSSHLNTTLCIEFWYSIFYDQLNKTEGLPLKYYNPYAPSNFARICNHSFFNLKNSEFLKFSDENSNDSDHAKAMILAMFGHEITDKELREDCKSPKDPLITRFWRQFYLIPYMLYPQYFVNAYKNSSFKQRYVLDNYYLTSQDMFKDICAKYGETTGDFLHMKISTASSMFNHYVISLLSLQKNNQHMFTDFAQLMSDCGSLVSAFVPSLIKELAQSIKEPVMFRDLSDEEALKYLQNGNNNSCLNYKEFIKNYGHRGYKEFDPLSKVWRDNPIPLIKALKTMLNRDPSTYTVSHKQSIGNIVDTLKSPLNFYRKFMLKNIVLPLARRAVMMREETKSTLIYTFDLSRQAFWKLADIMRSEGRLPESELLFHLTIEEIEQLLIIRSPLLIMKAKQRKKLYYKMDNWKFEEIIKGYNFKPINAFENKYEYIVGDVKIMGTPVSLGVVMARVCVAHSLEDAVNIQPGDILVTFSTDIGWSPYFPMISGIATEIGGLISHGAVIAREYGIPCLVGVGGACYALRTGETALLDCENGFIMRITDKRT